MRLTITLFTLDENGTLTTATIFDYETNASSYIITVQAKDEYNATVEGFTVIYSNPPKYSQYREGRVPIHTTQSQIPMDSP